LTSFFLLQLSLQLVKTKQPTGCPCPVLYIHPSRPIHLATQRHLLSFPYTSAFSNLALSLFSFFIILLSAINSTCSALLFSIASSHPSSPRLSRSLNNQYLPASIPSFRPLTPDETRRGEPASLAPSDPLLATTPPHRHKHKPLRHAQFIVH
jgi:hypothetical protein